MKSNKAPKLDRMAKTTFLKLTIARAVTPRARQRVHNLRDLERLLDRAVNRQHLGVQGHLLSSLSRRFPVSSRAIDLELQGFGPQGLVEAAEQIELHLWIPLYLGPRRQALQVRK